METCCRSVSSGLLIQSRSALSRLFDKPITRPCNRAVHLLGCGVVLGVKADEQLEGSIPRRRAQTIPQVVTVTCQFPPSKPLARALVKRFVQKRGNSLTRKFIYGITGPAISNWHDSPSPHSNVNSRIVYGCEW